MRIKFKRIENITTNPNPAGKTYPMIRVVGEALEGKLVGQEWSTKFFPSMKDMASVVKTCKVDDILDITMQKKGNYLNPVAIDIVDPSTMTLPAQVGPTIPTAIQSKSVLRRKNMQIAATIMGPKKAKDDVVEYLQDAAGVADLVGDYANESGAFQFDKKTTEAGIPDIDDVPDKEDVEVEEVPF